MAPHKNLPSFQKNHRQRAKPRKQETHSSSSDYDFLEDVDGPPFSYKRRSSEFVAQKASINIAADDLSSEEEFFSAAPSPRLLSSPDRGYEADTSLPIDALELSDGPDSPLQAVKSSVKSFVTEATSVTSSFDGRALEYSEPLSSETDITVPSAGNSFDCHHPPKPRGKKKPFGEIFIQGEGYESTDADTDIMDDVEPPHVPPPKALRSLTGGKQWPAQIRIQVSDSSEYDEHRAATTAAKKKDAEDMQQLVECVAKMESQVRVREVPPIPMDSTMDDEDDHFRIDAEELYYEQEHEEELREMDRVEEERQARLLSQVEPDEGSPTEVDTDEFGFDSSMEDVFNQVNVPCTTVSSSISNNPPAEHSNHCFSIRYSCFRSLPFFIQHEAVRAALSLGVNPIQCDEVLSTVIDDSTVESLISSDLHQQFCKSWKNFVQKLSESPYVPETNTKAIPEPITGKVWKSLENSLGWKDCVEMSGTVAWGKDYEGPFEIKLKPLTDSGHTSRFQNRFGSDRFLTLKLPVPSLQSGDKRPKNLEGLGREEMQRELRRRIIDWLVGGELNLMNRTWRCFYVGEGNDKGGKDKKKDKKEKQQKLRARFFAEKGVGLGEREVANYELGFEDVDKKIRDEITREKLVEWHLPFDDDVLQNSTVAKAWSRISLGLSTTLPTICFRYSEIEIVPDTLSPIGQEMDDGCSVCSPEVMRRVTAILGLDTSPTSVQGRLGGAKGLWTVDPTADRASKDVWIRINKSQLKYPIHDLDKSAGTMDPSRLTLDVLRYSHKYKPAFLNLQFIPILTSQGVPFASLKMLLEEHLDEELQELWKSLDDPERLRKWIFEHRGISPSRLTNAGTIAETANTLPRDQAEQIIKLLDAGFAPRQCSFLMERVRKQMVAMCDELANKFHIRVNKSTILYCIADPTDTLEEGEVTLYFSEGFLDPVDKRYIECLDEDILVARNPAHFPSDIQKVRAISTPNAHLRSLKDVIVFSTKGDVSLASKLSGGDYDGDKPWICWDPRLVSSFQNGPPPKPWGDRKNMYFDTSDTRVSEVSPNKHCTTDFFRAGFEISLREEMLGFATHVLEKHLYHKRGCMDKVAEDLAHMVSCLVDGPKQGLSLKPEAIKWLGEMNGRREMSNPRYKDPSGPIPKGRSETWHILDRLCFDVAHKKVEQEKVRFGTVEADQVDQDLTERWCSLHREAEKDTQSNLWKALKNLERDLKEVKQRTWAKVFRSRKDDRDEGDIPHFYESILPNALNEYRKIVPLDPSSRNDYPDCPESPRSLKRQRVENNRRQQPNSGPRETGNYHEWLSRTRQHEWVDVDYPLSPWGLLRASALFYFLKGNYAWWMATEEFIKLKVDAIAARTGFAPRMMTQRMYASLKPNSKFINDNEEVE